MRNKPNISKFFKIRIIGGKNSVGIPLYKYFLNSLKWGNGDMLHGYIKDNKLIIELHKKKE